jgi:MFS family permease
MENSSPRQNAHPNAAVCIAGRARPSNRLFVALALLNLICRPVGALAVALTVAIGAFMQMLDATIIDTALPQMDATFGASPVEVGLGIVVYVLAASIMILASAWIADRFGARQVFIAAISGFTLAKLSGLTDATNSNNS